MASAVDAKAAAAQAYAQLTSPVTPNDLTDVGKQYPALAPYLKNSVVGWGDGPKEYQSETYPYYEPDNPNPGKNTIQFYNRDLTSDQIKQLLPAEMLHVIGGTNAGKPVDPNWQVLKQNFLSSRTPEQLKADQEDYQQTKDPRSFGDYLQQSRGDAYLRGALFPEINSEWNDYLTPEQKGALADPLRAYLQGKK